MRVYQSVCDLCYLQYVVQLNPRCMWRVMALVATVSAVATQPRFLQTFSRIVADLSMNWMEGLYQRGWTFGAPSPPPRSFEEPPPMEGLQFAAGELYQHLLPGLSCVAVPLLAIGLWTVLGWLGKAVWFTGWILSWIGWLLSGCPCPKRSSLLGGSFGSKDEPPKGNVPKAWASSASVLGGAGLMAGQAVRADTPIPAPKAAPRPKEPMPREFGVDDLLKLAIQEDEFLRNKAFSDVPLGEPGPHFGSFHFDRRIRSGMYRGYRYDELLTVPAYISHVYQAGCKPGMEAIKAYYNFAMKHQIAVSAGKDA